VVGSSGSQGTRGRERVIVVDESLAPRMRRALRAHALRSPELRRFGLVLFALGFGVIAVTTRSHGLAVAFWSALVGSLPYALVMWAGTIWFTVRRWTRHFARELAPGRMLGLTVGPYSIRIRDHDSANEYAYSAINAVEVRDGVALIRPGSALWVVPIELFDPVDLGVLQTRAGKVGAAEPLLPRVAGTEAG
jgi:hypothetical protein